jgi:hypothetical protein
MKENIELQRAILRKQIGICRSLMREGYYPYNIKFHTSGHIEIEGRKVEDTDQQLLHHMVNDLSSIDAELPTQSLK